MSQLSRRLLNLPLRASRANRGATDIEVDISAATQDSSSPATDHPEPPAAQPRVDAGSLGLRDAGLSGWFRNETGEVFTDMPITPEDIVLDVGCGDGGPLSFGARMGASIIAVDIDEGTLQLAKDRLADMDVRDAEFHVGSAEDLPLAEDTATRVLCTEVLEHVDDPHKVLAELYRVGKPGALYLLTVPDEMSERLQEHVAPIEYFSKPNHIRVVPREEFPSWVTDAGFEIVRHSRYGFFWSIWWALFWSTESELPAPPNPVLDHWSAAWKALLDSPRGEEFQQALNEFLPRSQVIVARKPTAD